MNNTHHVKGRPLLGSYSISYSQELNILRPGIITEWITSCLRINGLSLK